MQYQQQQKTYTHFVSIFPSFLYISINSIHHNEFQFDFLSYRYDHHISWPNEVMLIKEGFVWWNQFFFFYINRFIYLTLFDFISNRIFFAIQILCILSIIGGFNFFSDYKTFWKRYIGFFQYRLSTKVWFTCLITENIALQMCLYVCLYVYKCLRL